MAVVCVFGALITKLTRVHILVNMAGFRRIKFSNELLFAIISSFCIIGLALLLIGLGLGNYELAQESIVDESTGLVTIHQFCSDQNPVTTYVLYGLEVVLMGGAFIMAVMIRDVPVYLNDSLVNGSVTSGSLTISVIIFSIMYTNSISKTEARLAVAIGYMVSIFFFLYVKLGEKLYLLYKELKSKRVSPSMSESNKNGPNKANGKLASDEKIPLITEDMVDAIREASLEEQRAFFFERFQKYKEIIIRLDTEAAFELGNKQFKRVIAVRKQSKNTSPSRK